MLQIDEELIEHWNNTLADAKAEEIILWAYQTFPGLIQTTAFGLTGLCIISILNQLNKDVPLVFIDTLYHFPQTYDLVKEVEDKYNIDVIVYKPKNVETESEFVKLYGDSLWETDQLKYDYLVKVEPLKRIYKELNVKAVFTGRRSTQGDSRSNLPIIEIDKVSNVIKINPLSSWTFDDVKKYIDENNIPRNSLLDLGYKSVGDWHSTVPVADGEDERSGRWKGQIKSECGIHVLHEYDHFEEKCDENENENSETK